MVTVLKSDSEHFTRNIAKFFIKAVLRRCSYKICYFEICSEGESIPKWMTSKSFHKTLMWLFIRCF